MRFASLGSGSKGNATLIEGGDTLVMVDCGFSAKETARRMARLGVDPAQLAAILVTHEHSDHSSGVGILSRKYQLPVYLTHGTLASGRCDKLYAHELVVCEEEFAIGELQVQPVAVPHDAREPCQYRFTHGGNSIGVLTDLGTVTPHVVEHYRGCDALLMEFNHDLGMLHDGPYPASLKQRVGGDWGHLNNQQAAAGLAQIGVDTLQHLVVAHISENNNSQALAEQSLRGVVPESCPLVWAQQSSGFGWLSLA